MRDPHLMPMVLEQLGALGVKLEIDDFGTGYSSLNFMRHFAGNAVKIDRSFIASMCDDQGSAEIVRAIVDLASNLNLGVIAEGVETNPQLEMIRRLGILYAQGFLFSRPQAPDGIESMLAPSETRVAAGS
jgi:EAL domain-containing protein (putative c-di-GMP-specific phosphodiesterase class I)